MNLVKFPTTRTVSPAARERERERERETEGGGVCALPQVVPHTARSPHGVPRTAHRRIWRRSGWRQCDSSGEPGSTDRHRQTQPQPQPHTHTHTHTRTHTHGLPVPALNSRYHPQVYQLSLTEFIRNRSTHPKPPTHTLAAVRLCTNLLPREVACVFLRG